MTSQPLQAFEQACRAAREGDLPALEQVLRDAPAVLHARGADGDSLLGVACKAATGEIAIPQVPGTPEQHAAVDRILAAGADPAAAAFWAEATPSYRKLAVNWVMTAKQQKTRDARAAQLVADSAAGRLIPSQRYGTPARWAERAAAAAEAARR